MKETINGVKRFLRCFIGDTIWVFRHYEKLKLQLEKHSIIDIKIYKFVRWHNGFNYFTGNYKGNRVFIKACCGEYDTIPAESHLACQNNFRNHPNIMAFEMEEYHWIATNFETIVPINHVDKNVDVINLIKQAVSVLDNMYYSGIIHRDLRPENICVNVKGELVLIDFGWAIYGDQNFKKTSYAFIEDILNQEYRNRGKKFDDALSMYMSFKDSFPFLTDTDLKPIIDRIDRLTA